MCIANLFFLFCLHVSMWQSLCSSCFNSFLLGSVGLVPLWKDICKIEKEVEELCFVLAWAIQLIMCHLSMKKIFSRVIFVSKPHHT